MSAAGGRVYIVDQSGGNANFQSGALTVAGYDYLSGQNRVIAVDGSGQLHVALDVDTITINSGNINVTMASGEVHVMSGAITLLSGGNSVGRVGINSGVVSVQSGEIHILSGSITLGSGGNDIGIVRVAGSAGVVQTTSTADEIDDSSFTLQSLVTAGIMYASDLEAGMVNKVQVALSGQGAIMVATSGSAYIISSIVSGNVRVIGENAVLGQSVAHSGAAVQPFITAASGGQAFFSGACNSLVVQYSPASPVAGVVYVSASGIATSGLGLAILSGAAPITIPVNAAQKVYAVATLSGILLSCVAL